MATPTTILDRILVSSLVALVCTTGCVESRSAEVTQPRSAEMTPPPVDQPSVHRVLAIGACTASEPPPPPRPRPKITMPASCSEPARTAAAASVTPGAAGVR